MINSLNLYNNPMIVLSSVFIEEEADRKLMQLTKMYTVLGGVEIWPSPWGKWSNLLIERWVLGEAAGDPESLQAVP